MHFASLQELQYELARRSLADFLRYSWPILEPGQSLKWGWYLDAICEHLEALYRGDIKKLLINIPPRHLKSVLASVAFPTWVWIQNPSERIISASYALELSRRDCTASRHLINSSWYQGLVRYCDQDWTLKDDQNTTTFYSNTSNGLRQALSIGSKTTGFGGNIRILDDPLNSDDRYSDAAIAGHIDWISRTWATRGIDPETDREMCIMQRLSDRDASAHLLELGGWEHLCLPTEFDSRKRCSTSLGWTDPRTKDGELLFPERFPKDVIDGLKKTLQSDFAGQHNQRPAPEDGLIFKAEQIRFWYQAGTLPKPWQTHTPKGLYTHEQIELPEQLDWKLQSWDFAFKDAKTSDFVCGQVWAQSKANAFLLDQIHDRLSFTASVDAVRTMKQRFPDAHTVLIEAKANGDAVMDTLKNDIPGLIAVTPEGGKVSRANAVTPFFRASNVFLPHPAQCPWVQGLIDELLAFPNAKNDDRCDALTQSLHYMFNNGFSFVV